MTGLDFTITGFTGTPCRSTWFSEAEALDRESADVAAVTLVEDGADFAEVRNDRGNIVSWAIREIQNGVPVIRRGNY